MGRTASRQGSFLEWQFAHYTLSSNRAAKSFFTKDFTVPSPQAADVFLDLRAVMEQTFVLKLVAGLDLKTGSARGHVEDVNTGKALRFHSVYELLTFLEDAAKERSSLKGKERQN